MLRYFVFTILAVIIMISSSITLCFYKFGTGNMYREVAALSAKNHQNFAKTMAEKSIAILENQPDKKQDLSKAYHVYGGILYEEKDLEGAKSYFTKGRECVDEKTLVWAEITFNLGRIAREQKKYIEAEELFYSSYEVEKELKEGYSVISGRWSLYWLYKYRMDPAQAEGHLTRRIQEFKDKGKTHSLVLAYEMLSGIYEKQKEYALALKQYDYIVELTTQFDYQKFIILCIENRQWEKAEKYLNRALEREECEMSWVYDELAFCKVMQRRFDEAKKDIEVLESFEIDAWLANNIAYLYVLVGDKEQSMQYVQKAKELLKNSGLPATIYDTVACSYELNGQLDLAEKYFLRAIELGDMEGREPHCTAKTYISLGNVYLKQNRVEDARQVWKESLEHTGPPLSQSFVNKVRYNLEHQPVEIPRIEQY